MKLISSLLVVCFFYTAQAQLVDSAFSFYCERETALSCSTSCFTLEAKVPYIAGYTSNYTVTKANCFIPDVSPETVSGTAILEGDDQYSGTITLPFNFPFYGDQYNALVAGTNGTVSFDLTNANSAAPWNINANPPTTSYERALIMGPFHDLDISAITSPARLVKYEITGTKPYRKFVYSLNKVPDFRCTTLVNNTSQIILYESLGLVEVLVWERQACATWNSGRALIGMQDYNRDRAIMAPGREFSSPSWGGVPLNEQWRFAPKDGPSLLKKVELYKNTGEFVALGDTAYDGNGGYNVSFPNICVDSILTNYVIQPVYYNYEYSMDPTSWPSNDADSLVYGKDLFRVYKNAADPAQAVWTGAADSTWENPANWACNNLPTNVTAVTISSGTVIINSNVTINKLTVMPGVNLVVNPGYDLTILNP